MKQKRKFNLTPQAHKSIIETARALPQMVRLNPDGSQQYRATTEYKGGGRYFKGKEPVFINHEVEMINRFWASGPEGVAAYVNRVNEIMARHEAKEAVEDGGKPLDPNIVEPQNDEPNESNS